MIYPPYRVELLGKHDRNGFECGKDSLDRNLREIVGQDTRQNLSRCFVLVHEVQPNTILGYYTLSNGGITPDQGPPATQRVRRYSQVGTLLLGRFAIDQSQQGKGMGRKLLLHIMSHVVRLSTETGFQLLLVDPLDHMASEFYRRFGFVALPGESRMYMQLANLRATLENLG